ncbi:hypothetical protein [Oceanobacillus profundus]|uniref:Uncharacterized protein n=1 Tax=Oceanobacillus profundus TaxID=372463 RepID=A0A417YGU0_9BACI|nr:hypothetical protein [Oceanobacillus profundus]MBR2245616.1 hypothetical protein [Bacilli bacterium]MBR3121334.1 hypothetical protein [Oceanobacillus sp.]RHW32023.1 hypothetical protein D1B32_12365 [Oceanobacillus profundus]
MKMPISKPGKARFRGPTSSNDYNVTEDDLYLDLLNLFQESNNNKNKLREAFQAILAENIALQNYAEKLESELNELEVKLNVIDKRNEFYNGRFFKTGFVSDMRTEYLLADQNENDTGLRGEIDIHHRFATLPLISQTPKTHVLDKNNNIIVPDSLEVEVTSQTNGDVEENNIMNAFNGDKHSYWRREVSYDPLSAPQKESVTIEVNIPSNLVNNLNINTININPHPERGVEITNVEMHYNNAWATIDGFRQDELSDTRQLSPKRKWYFASRPVQRIRITLTQHYPLQVGEKKVFVIGAQDIGIHLSSFDTNGGFVLVPVNMADVGMYSIDSVEPIFLNERALSYSKVLDDLEGNIYDFSILKEQNGYLQAIGESEWTNQISKQLWVKIHLYPDPNNGVNPCLHALRLHYSKV